MVGTICHDVGELVHQKLRPGIEMRLEDKPDLPVRNMGGCVERRLDFVRMMRVVVDDVCAVIDTFVLEAALGAGEV